MLKLKVVDVFYQKLKVVRALQPVLHSVGMNKKQVWLI